MAELRDLVLYNPDTGLLTRKVSSGRAKAGNPAGSLTTDGYIELWIGGVKYRAHRVAWFLMTGEWPERIDHINQNKADNRWSNLRIATNQQNMVNTGLQSNNTSGFRGVSFHKGAGKWMAYVKVGGRRQYLGLHGTPDVAATVAAGARIHAFGEFAHV